MSQSAKAAPAWRSLLFVPAHVERYVSSAPKRGADGVILDLEDAVPVAEKEAARAALPASIQTVGQGGAAALVRVNHGIRLLARDLEAAVVEGLAAVVLPKVDSASYVVEVSDAVAELEVERGLPPGEIRLVLQIETPGALFDLPAIARSHPRIAAMTIGPEDFSAACGAVPDADSMLAPNLAVLYAARAAGILPLGFVGSIGSFSDLDAFRETVRRAGRLGFRGALVIHPAQVAILNEAFSPTPDEVAWAQRVVAADEAARREGRGAFQLDGKMVDAPVVRRAQDILAVASAFHSPAGA